MNCAMLVFGAKGAIWIFIHYLQITEKEVSLGLMP